MPDLNASPRWRAPPGLGSKDRDAEWVAQCLHSFLPATLVLPTAGLGKELCEYGGSANLIVADTDPTVRAYWRGAVNGQLVRARARAVALWADRLGYYSARDRDPVLAAWRDIVAQANAAANEETLDEVALSMMVMAGAHTGKRRRAKSTGDINISTVPKSRATGCRDSAFLPSRLPSVEALISAERWAQCRADSALHPRSVRIFETFARAMIAALDARAPVVYLVDPPYGPEKGHVYTSDWTDDKRDVLASHLAGGLQLRWSAAIVWCDAADYPVFAARCPSLRWFLRPTKTAMKAKSATEPTRFGMGSYVGVSPQFVSFLPDLTPVH